MRHRTFLLLLISILILSCSRSDTPTINNIPTPAGENSKLSFLTSDSSGDIYLSWVEPAPLEGGFSLNYAVLKNDRWSAGKTIAASDGWFVNWADYPSIAANEQGITAAHVLNKKPGNTYAYDVNIYLKQKDSEWSEPVTPHYDSTATEHGFVSMASWNDKMLAIWLDGRRSENRTEQEYFNINKAMTLRSAFIGTDGSITQKERIDDSVCDCCNTAIALTDKGAITAYRNRTDDEVRDIYVSRFNGNKWSDPTPVHHDNWKIAGCPVNGPSVAAADSTVAVAWFTAADGEKLVKAAISNNYGETFSEPIIIGNENPLGRVKTVMSRNGNIYVSWMQKSANGALLKLKAVKPNQEVSSEFTIAKMSASRKSGFPQMAISTDRLIFAWTRADSSTSVQTASLPLGALFD